MSDVLEGLIIDESNFSTYFRDVRKNKPRAGEIMARFTAWAEFVESPAKQDVIDLLKRNKGSQAAQVMRKLHGAKEPDCFRVCREMCEDLLTLSEQEVLQKPYTFIVEYFFYTQREYVPDDKHWETIKLLHYNRESGGYDSKIEL